MTLEKYSADITAYLKSKLEYIPEHTVMEIADYIAVKTQIFTNDYIKDMQRYELRLDEKSFITAYREALKQRGKANESKNEINR